MRNVCHVGGVTIGAGSPLVVIGGPCTLESPALGLQVGRGLHAACCAAGLPYIFKASFDKANRTSLSGARGPGLERGLDSIASIGASLGVPTTTDLHEPRQASAVARAVDLVQIPAFLCRQTDLLLAAGRAAAEHGAGVNVKKGQFLSPSELSGPLGKIESTGCKNALVTERGTFFGYHRLVNDFVGLGDMLAGPVPVCFDVTHSTQQPGAQGGSSGGRPERAPLLARAAVAAGVDAVFIECHPDPANAHSDGATMLPLGCAVSLVGELARLRAAVEVSSAR